MRTAQAQALRAGQHRVRTAELVVLVDDKGMPTGTDYVVYDITHQLVEEFMLKANEIVAWHLSERR